VRHGSSALLVITALPNFCTAASIVARQPVNGYGPNASKSNRGSDWAALLPADVAPQVRIDRALDDEGAALFEERLQLGRQQRDHPIGDELVGLEAPRDGG
jgi:hypothetical protein